MFGYKRSISVFASKTGSWLITLCQISQEKCQTNFKNLYFAMQIAKNLGISLCTCHGAARGSQERGDEDVTNRVFNG